MVKRGDPEVNRESKRKAARRPAFRKLMVKRSTRRSIGDGADVDVAELTKAQVREIERRIRDLDDPIRYLLVSDFGPRFKLYYEASDGVFVMNRPADATLFKRREVALAVKATLRDGIKLIRGRTVIRGGKRVPLLPKRMTRHTRVAQRRSRLTRS
jgi:hypothetical protein